MKYLVTVRACIGGRLARRQKSADFSIMAGGFPTSRACGYEPQPRDATPRSAFRIVSRRRPLMSEDANPYHSFDL